MADTLTPQERHRNMAAIRGSSTKPEMLVRKYLFSKGFRYRLNYERLSGRPDIVLRRYRTCIFVNGCFWHGHMSDTEQGPVACRYFRMPKTRTEYWTEKIERNRARDAEVIGKLAKMGWHSITVWECQLRGAGREETLRSLEHTLYEILIMDIGEGRSSRR